MEKNILCCINGFKPSEAVIDYASWLSKKSNSTLKLFHAIDTLYHENETDLSGNIGLGTREELLEEFVQTEHEQNKLLHKRGKIILDAGQKRAERNGVFQINQSLRKGKVIENILDLKNSITIAVIGKSRIGHKVEAIVRAVEKPILIVSEDFKDPTSMCLAFDGSEGSKKALDFVIQNASFQGLKIYLVHVGEGSEKLISDLNNARDLLEKAAISSEIVLLKGEVADSLNDYIIKNNISMLSMGAFSHSWLRDMVMGSLTSKVISMMNIPVLLVR